MAREPRLPISKWVGRCIKGDGANQNAFRKRHTAKLPTLANNLDLHIPHAGNCKGRLLRSPPSFARDWRQERQFLLVKLVLIYGVSNVLVHFASQHVAMLHALVHRQCPSTAALSFPCECKPHAVAMLLTVLIASNCCCFARTCPWLCFFLHSTNPLSDCCSNALHKPTLSVSSCHSRR